MLFLHCVGLNLKVESAFKAEIIIYCNLNQKSRFDKIYSGTQKEEFSVLFGKGWRGKDLMHNLIALSFSLRSVYYIILKSNYAAKVKCQTADVW